MGPDFPYYKGRRRLLSLRRFLQIAVIIVILTMPEGLEARLSERAPARMILWGVFALLTAWPLLCRAARTVQDLLTDSRIRRFHRYSKSLRRKKGAGEQGAER